MPIYEYRCRRCHREFSILITHLRALHEVSCKFCESKNVKRLYSVFSVHQSDESRMAAIDTSKSPGEGFYRDSRNIGLRAKKRMRELGVDLGSKMDEIVEKGRTGKILDDYHE